MKCYNSFITCTGALMKATPCDLQVRREDHFLQDGSPLEHFLVTFFHLHLRHESAFLGSRRFYCTLEIVTIREMGIPYLSLYTHHKALHNLWKWLITVRKESENFWYLIRSLTTNKFCVTRVQGTNKKYKRKETFMFLYKIIYREKYHWERIWRHYFVV